MSFFGGDRSIAHFTCHLSIATYPIGSQKRRDAYKKIADAFGREKYFSFNVGSADLKAAARAACEKHAEKILAKTGIETEVSEGCFL